MKYCAACNQMAFNCCSKCPDVFYCSNCQAADWSTHKNMRGEAVPIVGEVGSAVPKSMLDAVKHLETHKSPETCFRCAFEEFQRYETIEEDEELFLTARSSTSADDETSSPNISFDCIDDDSEKEESSDSAVVSPRDASSEPTAQEVPVVVSSEISDSDNEEEQSVTEDAAGSPRYGSSLPDAREIPAVDNNESKIDELSMKGAAVAALDHVLTENQGMQPGKEDAVGSPGDGSSQAASREIPVVENSENENDELSMKEPVLAALDYVLTENKEVQSGTEDAVAPPCDGSSQPDAREIPSVENYESENEKEQLLNEELFSLRREALSEAGAVAKCKKILTGERTPDTRDDSTQTLETTSCSSMKAFEAITQSKPRRKSRRGEMQMWVPKRLSAEYQPRKRQTRRRSSRVWMPKAEWAGYFMELRKLRDYESGRRSHPRSSSTTWFRGPKNNIDKQ
eukprot:GEMP01041873.1.p1 GENE.GEMP01041873.1~~GEMP01041873.1.p1  ORF type:complete len:455 (+),score=116.73 GEMP01041873.1:55-1419(+)